MLNWLLETTSFNSMVLLSVTASVSPSIMSSCTPNMTAPTSSRMENLKTQLLMVGLINMEEFMDGNLTKLKLDIVEILIMVTGLLVMDSVLNLTHLQIKDTLKLSPFPKLNSTTSMSR